MLDLNTNNSDAIPNNQDIPTNSLDIFYQNVSAFLPPGKTFDELTEQEKAEVMNKYRFAPLRPSNYQGITGIGNHGRGGM